MPASAPDARRHVLAISGMIDAAAAAEIEAALVALDPAARVAVSLPAGLVAVASTVPASVLAGAVVAAGFGAEPTARPFPPPPAETVGRSIGRIVAWTFAGAVLVPIAVFVLMAIAVAIDPVCGTPGDSGGCYMSLVSVPILSAGPGAVIGTVAGLVRTVWRRRAGAPTETPQGTP